MIYLAHYKCTECDSSRKVKEQQGIINAGNSKEAVEKVFKIVGPPVVFNPDSIKHDQQESVYNQKDNKGISHLIRVSHVDHMMTIEGE